MSFSGRCSPISSAQPTIYSSASRPEATIEINLGKLQQLFNSFDPSPFHDRDLDHVSAIARSSAAVGSPRSPRRTRSRAERGEDWCKLSREIAVCGPRNRPDRSARRDIDLHQRGLPRLHSRYGPPDRSAAQRDLCPTSSPAGCPTKSPVSYQINLHHHPNQNDSNNGAPTLIEILQ